MKNFNYFADSNSAISYFRLPFQGKGTHCITAKSQPFLREVSIQIQWQISPGDLNNDTPYQSHWEIISTLKPAKQKPDTEFLSIPVQNCEFFEDLLVYQDEANKITIQALNRDEAYLVWEKTSSQPTLHFHGKLEIPQPRFPALRKLLSSFYRSCPKFIRTRN